MEDSEPFRGMLSDETTLPQPVFATKDAAFAIGSFEEEASFLERMLEGQHPPASTSVTTGSRVAVSATATAVLQKRRL
jgi:hypothetical protein